MPRIRPVFVVSILCGLLAAATGAAPALASTAQAAIVYPQPPCAGGPHPAYPRVDEPPAIRVWRDGEIQGWRPAECTGFDPLAVNSVIATAARFRHTGSIEALARRIAQVSALTGIKYFSVHEDRWKPMLVNAYALRDGAGADNPARRADFTDADVAPGRSLRYWQEENSILSPVVYRLHVRERTPDRLVYSIVNESPMKVLFLRATQPGEFRQLYVIERDLESAAGDVWRYYSLVHARMTTGPFSLSTGSFMNRAAAYFRHIAGIPTDQEPPAAR